jgi:hypothetical protein
MNSMQPPGRNSLIDSTRTETLFDELRKPDHSVLARRQSRDHVVQRHTPRPTGRFPTA